MLCGNSRFPRESPGLILRYERPRQIPAERKEPGARRDEGERRPRELLVPFGERALRLRDRVGLGPPFPLESVRDAKTLRSDRPGALGEAAGRPGAHMCGFRAEDRGFERPFAPDPLRANALGIRAGACGAGVRAAAREERDRDRDTDGEVVGLELLEVVVVVVDARQAGVLGL